MLAAYNLLIEVSVNEYLQCVSNPEVYAAGDVAANMGLPLTPVASYDGAVVANNLIKGNTMKSNYTGLPSVVFTIPPLASVGILGAHILGPHADEIINIFSMAIRLGLTAKDLNDPLLYTYPTNSSNILYML